MRQELWMKHDARSRFDPKMATFISRHGMEGYGMFWAILEILHYQNDHEICMDTEFEGVAAQLHCRTEQLQPIVESLVEIGLFRLEENRLFQARMKQEQAERSTATAATSAIKGHAGRIGGLVAAAKRRGAKPEEIEAIRSSAVAGAVAPVAYALDRRERRERSLSNYLSTKPEEGHQGAAEPVAETKQKKPGRPYRDFKMEDFKFPVRFGPQARAAVKEWVEYKAEAGHPKLLTSYQAEIECYRDRPEHYACFVQRAVKEQWQGFNEKVPLEPDQGSKTQQRPATSFERNMEARQRLVEQNGGTNGDIA